MTDIVILPGIGGSGELHWQTRWEKINPRYRRFQPTDWNQPELDDWISALDRVVCAASKPPLLVAHSLACLLVAHWQQVSTAPVAGAFLVAVPSPQSEAFPVEAASFANPPFEQIQVSLTHHRERERSIWHDRACPRESEPVGKRPCGSGRAWLNEASGLGDWPQGKALLVAFAAGVANDIHSKLHYGASALRFAEKPRAVESSRPARRAKPIR